MSGNLLYWQEQISIAMNMEIDKQKFRDLIESEQVGQALNQLSDISHILGQGELQDELSDIAEQFQEVEEMAEDEEGREMLQLKLKNRLLELVDRLPEDFSTGSSGEEGSSGGCLGMITMLILLSLLLWTSI